MDKYQTLREKDNPNNNVYPNIQPQNIPSYSITSDKLAVGAVDNVALSNNAVSPAKILDLAVTTSKLNDYAVTEEKLATGSVTSDKLASNAITQGKIASNSVTYGKIKKTFQPLTQYITGDSWSDERYFADDIDGILRSGGKLLLIFNDYVSDVNVSASSFNGITIFKFTGYGDNFTPLPTSSVLVNGVAVIDDPQDLTPFYNDIAPYLYVWRIASN